MDQTGDGDVQQDTRTQRDVDADTRVLTVNRQHTADAGSVAQESLPLEPATHQIVVGDIPLEPPGFLLRADLLAKLDRPGARVVVIHAVTGLRGLGTTQLAAAYARAKVAADWRMVAWINAADIDSVQTGLAAAADAMGLMDSDSGRDVVDADKAVRHLLENDGDRCLLVFDDAADPEVLRPFIPASGTARVLITSTRPPASNLAIGVPMDVFSADEALRFLTGRTGLDDEAGAAAVAAVLGHLPLALALAAPMIEEQHHGYASYLDRLQTIPIDVFLTGDDGQSYPRGVMRTVVLSLAIIRAADQTGVCTRVMEIMAVLSAAGVRRELLHVAGHAGVLASGGHRVEAALVDRVLEWLSERSLLTFSLDGETVITHPPVAQVVRNRLARRRRLGAVCWAAASALEAHAIALTEPQDRLALRSIPQHVTALLDNAPKLAGKADEELVAILLGLRFIVLHHLIELGDSVPQAIAVGEPLTADLERLLGPDHPDTLNSRNSLAAAYLAAGRAAEAIPLFEQILSIRERLLGPDDPDTLTSWNNLAAAYQDAGRAAEAIQLFEQTLSIREQLFGTDHPSTLNSRGNLAAAYRDGGRAAEAIRLFEQTLAERERVLGADHPDTQTSRKNLANTYQDVGRAAEAIPLFEQVLADRKRALRPYHVRTQITAKSLATAHRDGGRGLAARESESSADAARHVPSVGFRRPPTDPARQVLPTGFRRPPADPARRLVSDSVAGLSAKLIDHSSSARTQDPPPVDVQYDRELVSAIAAGDPAGIAMAYDMYAAGLYRYCHWMLRDPTGSAEALQDTFVIAAATPSDLPQASKLRSWLYAVARSECRRRCGPVSAARDAKDDAANQQAHAGQPTDATREPADATMPFRVVSQPTDATREPADATMPFRVVNLPADATMPFRVVDLAADATMPFRVVNLSADATNGLAQANGDLGQAEVRTLIRSVVAELKPREREVIELSFRHDLHDNDLAIALGVSPSRAHARASRAYGRLEEALGALYIAFTRREACPGLGELLADWDGQLAEQVRDLVVWHIEQCQTCANHGRGALSPAAFSRLLPLAPLPPELRKQVLTRCTSTAEDAVAYRRRVARRAESRWFARFSLAVRQLSWDNIRANPGAAIATVAVAVWVVAAVSVTLFTFAGSNPAHAQAVRPNVRTSSSSPAATATTPTANATARKSAVARPSRTVSRPSAYVPPPVQLSSPPSPSPSPSPSKSSSPSPSPSPSPSKSSSPSPSPSRSPSKSSSPSPSSSKSSSPMRSRSSSSGSSSPSPSATA